MVPRRPSRRIMVGGVAVGGGAPVSIQSMTNTPTRDVEATLAQIGRLAALGCEIVRVAVDGPGDLRSFGAIVEASPLPVVADIQFDSRAAIGAIGCRAAALRLNPGLITDEAALDEIARAAADAGIPIRVGANSGSVRPHLVRARIAAGMSRDDALAETLVESVLAQCDALAVRGVRAIKAALKSSSVAVTVAANRKFAERSDLALHLGVTEAGTLRRGVIKSAAGIGALLLEGIGDTIRVSLTAPPEEEVKAALALLECCEVRPARPEIVSCPTCGRTEIDLPGLAGRVEELVASIKASGRRITLAKIAVMGCPVNGPGEARDADLGLAGSRNGQVVLFKHGETLGAFDAERGFEALRQEILAASERQPEARIPMTTPRANTKE